MIESPPAPREVREVFDPQSITDENYVPSTAPNPAEDAQAHALRFRFNYYIPQEGDDDSPLMIRTAAFEGYGCNHGFGSNCLCK